MSWSDYYLSGSFRGIPFRTRDTRLAGGRRIVEHVFPERDNAYYEDLGLRNHTFTFSCYVIGDDYFKQRNDLIGAFEQSGPGLLIHPYLGSINVFVTDWDCTESSDEGRIARFSVTFKREFDLFLTVVGPSALDKLQQAKGNFLDAALAALVKAYNVITKPLAVLQDAINVGNKILDIIDQAKKITGAYREYRAKIDSVKGLFFESVLLAEGMGNDFIDIIDFGADVSDPITSAITIGDSAKTQYDELRAVTDIQDSVLTDYPTLAESQADFPAMLIQTFVSDVALASRAGLTGTMSLNSSNDADNVMLEIGRLVNQIEQRDNVDDDLYATSRDLRVAVHDVLADRRLLLHRLDSIELSDSEPSLVTSWRVYKSLDREDEILGLNRVIDPGFIPHSKPVYVVGDD